MSNSIYRQIGGDSVHGIGFGAMGISFYYGAIESDEERLKVLDAAYNLGSRHWDSSNIYGDSEELIGKWFKRTGKRNEIFLATKFGITPQGPRGDPAYARECLETSLKRLGVDYVDLYYIHRIDSKIPIEVTMREMAKFVKEGKVKHIGLSECSAATLRRAHAIHPIAAVQLEVSPFVLDIWDEKIALAKTAKELGVTIVAYSPLARGLLSGRFKSPDEFEANDFRRTVPKFSKENFPKILNVVSKLEEIGRKHNATAGQVTLAWVLAKGDNFVVIPGTKKTKYLEENMGAEKVHLSAEEVAAIDKIAKAAEVDIPGERYGEWAMNFCLADTPREN
ncbi:hypothetical protein AX16_009792 [Volvariella volvacea WC 439]|nr:hypothetical protein AX16_009792 [Volvariella volvacea WC 439]